MSLKDDPKVDPTQFDEIPADDPRKERIRYYMDGVRYETEPHLFEVQGLNNYDGMQITIEDEDYLLFESREEAGQQAAEYYRDMAESWPNEFIIIVGEETLIKWALGKPASPSSTSSKGTRSANSLDEWLEEVIPNAPEELWASFDGQEHTFQYPVNENAYVDLDHLEIYGVAYRTY